MPTDSETVLHDHLGDTLDPVLFSGVGLHLLVTASGPRSMVAAVVGASLIWVMGVTFQPFRRSSDRLSSEVVSHV